jgi:hypothetical protein
MTLVCIPQTGVQHPYIEALTDPFFVQYFLKMYSPLNSEMKKELLKPCDNLDTHFSQEETGIWGFNIASQPHFIFIFYILVWILRAPIYL